MCYYHVKDCNTFYDFLEEIYRKYGNRIAFMDSSHKWTYKDLYYSVTRISSYFVHESKSFFNIKINNPYYFCVAFFAIEISGKVAMLNITPSVIELENQYMDITEEVVVQLLRTSHDFTIIGDCNPNKVAIIVQSSGTTSIAKGVMLSQRNLITNTISGMRCFEYPEGAVYYHVLPSYHLFGLVADLLGPLYSGGIITFSDNNLNFFKDLRYFKPTNMNLPPALVYMIEQMLKTTHDKTMATGGKLCKIMCAGAHLNEESVKVLRQYEIEVYVAYGLTECSPCISMNSELSTKENSVGRILPCCEVAIDNGEIVVRGDNVMIGYWNDSLATENIIKQGWLHTGDLGYLDDEGFLYLTGRKSNLIVFENGIKLIPELVEKEINSLRSIRECLITHVLVGKRVYIEVFLVSLEGSDRKEIYNEVKRCLEKYNLSSRISNITITNQELPKNQLGKIIRNIKEIENKQ